VHLPRIHTVQPLQAGALVKLEPEASHHLSRVLRLDAGASIIVFNGGPSEFAASIESAARDCVNLRIGDERFPVRESPLCIHLGQGISRGERMDYTLQKSVELGVTSITPLWVARTQIRLEGKRLEKRLEHWRGVIRSACEQSGRLRIPALQTAVTLDAWAAHLPADFRKLLLDPAADSSLRDQTTPEADVAILIGPEGGLDPAEICRARSLGFVGLKLGPRVLRTETAAVAALSVLQAFWGDLA
jgi:16S rRNA (uracil1498-N3)-methyltransferase